MSPAGKGKRVRTMAAGAKRTREGEAPASSRKGDRGGGKRTGIDDASHDDNRQSGSSGGDLQHLFRKRRLDRLLG
jgi:hypothetical protein